VATTSKPSCDAKVVSEVGWQPCWTFAGRLAGRRPALAYAVEVAVWALLGAVIGVFLVGPVARFMGLGELSGWAAAPAWEKALVGALAGAIATTGWILPPDCV